MKIGMRTMDKYISKFAPYITIFIIFCVQCNIFLTPAKFQEEKALFFQYIAEHYVSDKTYRENHKALQDQLSQIHSDINEVKNILIKKDM